MMPLGRLSEIRLCAYDIDRTWGDGHEIRGQAIELMMASNIGLASSVACDIRPL